MLRSLSDLPQTAEERQSHNTFRKWRNKHFANSFNVLSLPSSINVYDSRVSTEIDLEKLSESVY